MESLRERFWHNFLRGLKSEIKGIFEIGPEPFCLIENEQIDVMLEDLIYDLDSLLLPIIPDYINENIDSDASVANDRGYGAFFASFENTMNILESEYSYILINIHNRIRRYSQHVLVTLNRIYQDWEEICYKFKIDNSLKIGSIYFACGDEHHLGGQTSVFKFTDENVAFVYKPVDIELTILAKDLKAYVDSGFNQHLDSSNAISKVDKYNNSNYGYIKYIPYNGNLKNIEEVRKIYEKFGEVLAFSRFFKIADGHCDNIVINYPEVHFIDLENAFHFFSDAAIEPIEQTGLLIRARKENTIFGLITGIQGGTLPRINLTKPFAQNDGTNNISIKYFGLIHDAKTNQHNRVYLDGKLCLPEDYIVEIKTGYATYINTLIDNKSKILNFIESSFIKNKIKVRHLIKATAFYSRYISLLNHVTAAKKGNSLSFLRKELANINAKENAALFITDNEIRDICNGVIPYFYRDSVSTSIFHISGFYQKDYFSRGLLDDISSYIKSIEKQDIDKDLIFIEEALKSTTKLDNWDDFKTKFDYPEFV